MAVEKIDFKIGFKRINRSKIDPKRKNLKRGALFQVILIIVALIITAVFIYGIADLNRQKNSGNETVKSFGDFLDDVFRRTEVKEKAKDAEKTLGCMAKVNQCTMHDITCMPIYSEGQITFIMTNTVKRINYGLNDVHVAIQAGGCSGNLTGPAKLYGSGGAGPMSGNYTIPCRFDKCLEGNITFQGITNEQVGFNERGKFSIKG